MLTRHVAGHRRLLPLAVLEHCLDLGDVADGGGVVVGALALESRRTSSDVTVEHSQLGERVVPGVHVININTVHPLTIR